MAARDRRLLNLPSTASGSALVGPRGNARWQGVHPITHTPGKIHAVFTGGPRHRQTYEVGGSPAPMITVPSPEGTHAYERTSYDEAALVARYKHVGIIEGSDEPDEIGLQLVSALATIAKHVTDATALSPGSIMLPEHVFPGVRSVMGLEVVRGDRVALLLELFQPPVDEEPAGNDR